MHTQPTDDRSLSVPDASSGEQARERRAAALGKLARDAAASSQRIGDDGGDKLRTFGARTVPRRARRLIAGVVVVAVALVGAGAYFKVHPANSPRPEVPATISIPVASCGDAPAALAWAPDGRRLAVVSPSASCGQPGQGTPPGMQTASLAIYDARSGTLVSEMPLGSLLGSMANVAILTAVSWSPDGHLIAIHVWFNSPATVAPQALLLVPAQGGQARTIDGTPPSATKQILWNVANGSVAGSEPAIVPLALSYTWSAAGVLSPAQAFPASSSTRHTGRPVPRDGLSFWQAGQIQPIYHLDAQGGADRSKPVTAEQFISTPVMWSPEGQVVAFGLTFQGPVAFDTSPDPQTCQQLYLSAPCGSDLLPFPDAAFVRVLNQVRQPISIAVEGQGPIVSYPSAPVVWSPSGKVLATILPADQVGEFYDQNNLTARVSLFSTSTGARIGTRDYRCANPNSCDARALVWSPTGNQLALLDGADGVVTIWNTQGLGV